MLGRYGKGLIHLFDILMINVTFYLVLILRFEGAVPTRYKELYHEYAVVLTLIMILAFYGFGLYRSLWQYASIKEMIQILLACCSGELAFIVYGIAKSEVFPKSIYILFGVLLVAGIGFSRFEYRLLRRALRLWEKQKASALHMEKGKAKKRVMLVGAGEAASLIIKDMAITTDSHKDIILCVDDKKKKQGLMLKGVPIRGTTEDIVALTKAYEIDEIIIAIPSASKKRISEIVNICNQTNCKLKIFPGIYEVLHHNTKKRDLVRDVKVEDLLGREEINLHNEKVKKIIKDKTVIVTGGGGSIGSELCRQIIKLNPRRLLIFDIYENNAYDLQMELIQSGVPREKLVMLIGSVRDKEKLEEVFSTYRPDLVFHAAAHKHVPLMEHNPGDAVKNNVFGTLNVAQCAKKYGCSKFVMVSTDKAVNPTNVMGATKRVCEMIVQAMNGVSEKTEFVAVRFGNVLGSNGSVIPLFKKQLAAGGPLTVTHPEIIRYFMTIPEAVRLILEASSFAKGGEIFVLDMGEPVKIHDLAKNFIKLSGLEEDKDIKIQFTGLRPGEKLYEELLMSEEGLRKTESEKIFIGKQSEVNYQELMWALEGLKGTIARREDVREALREIVPTYIIPEYNSQIV